MTVCIKCSECEHYDHPNCTNRRRPTGAMLQLAVAIFGEDVTACCCCWSVEADRQ